MSEHALSFGPVAAVYERGRPSYPAAALDWLLPSDATRVVDVGAGTGKLTRLLHGRGLTVTAVDPSDGMRTELHRVLPAVPVPAGTAEDLPLDDHSVDAVLCAQAWHWVDAGRAVPEIARVLVPGGRLGLIWNLRDERVDWVRRLGEIIGSPAMHRPAALDAPFGPTETRDFAWTHRTGTGRLLDLVASRSSVILLGADERAVVLDRVRHLVATHPDLAGRETFPLPYLTRCARADLMQR